MSTQTIWNRATIDSTSTPCEKCDDPAINRWETIGRPAPDGTIRTYRCGTHAPLGETSKGDSCSRGDLTASVAPY